MKSGKASYDHLDPEERYRNLFDKAQDGILILDAHTGVILDANPFIANLSGYSVEELLGKHLWDLGFIQNIKENKDKFSELQKKGYVRYESLPIETKMGTRQFVEFISSRYSIGGGDVVQCNIRDINAQVLLDKLNKELNMMYQVIIRCNQVLLHENSISALIGQMCEILVSSGGLMAAWVGYVPLKSGDLISPIAAGGLNMDYFRQLNLDAQRKEPKGLVANAICSQTLLICQDLQKDEQDKSARELAITHQFHSAAVMPITSLDGRPCIMVVYGHNPNDLTEELIGLLKNLAIDIAFGIDNIEVQAERLKLAEKLDLSLNSTIQAISTMVEQRDLYTSGHQHRVADLAVAIATELGLSDQQKKGLHMACVVHDISKIRIPAEILSKPGLLSDEEFEIIKTHPKVYQPAHRIRAVSISS
jgi:PAS domain S-box-containing protein